MIRLVTYGNFPVLDLQIEQAYRERRRARDVLFLDDTGEVAVLRSVGKPRRRVDRSRSWLQKLARAVAALDEERLSAHPRLVAANATGLAPARKRRKRAKRQ